MSETTVPAATADTAPSPQNTEVPKTCLKDDGSRQPGGRRVFWLCGLFLLLFALLWYIDILDKGFFADDHNVFKEDAPWLRFYTIKGQVNLLIGFFTTLKIPADFELFGRGVVRPLRTLPFAVINEISGISPKSLHFHCLLAILILTYSYYLFLQLWGLSPPVSALCSAILVVHPTTPYFACWATELMYMWVAWMAIWSTAAFLRGLQATGVAAKLVWAFLCCLFYAVGLLISEIILPMPAMWAFIWWRRRTEFAKPIATAAGFVLPALLLAIAYVLVWFATVSINEFAPEGEHASSIIGRGVLVLLAVYASHILEVIIQQIIPYWNVSKVFWLAMMVLFGILAMARIWRDRSLRECLTPAIAWCAIFSLLFFTFPGARTHAVVYLASPVLIGLPATAICRDAWRRIRPRETAQAPRVRLVPHILTLLLAVLFLLSLIQTNLSLKRHIADTTTVYHTMPTALRTRAADLVKSQLSLPRSSPQVTPAK